MFILTLTYRKSLEDVERHLAAHRNFLEEFYQKGKIIVSGPREPRAGGIIICNASCLNEVNQIISHDPFFIHRIADYEITMFHATKFNTSNFLSGIE